MNTFKDIFTNFDEDTACIVSTNEELFSIYLKNFLDKNNNDIILVTSSLYEANKIFSTLQNHTDNAYLFSMDDFLTSEAIAISPDLMVSRLETLNSIIKEKNKKIIVTNLMGYLRFLPVKNIYESSILKIEKDKEYDMNLLKKNLYNIGYKKETLVTKTGEFGARGFVIDVFPLGEMHPVRLEFFGDTVESIRYFDEDNQKSLKEIDEISFYPFSEYILDNVDNLDDNIYHKNLKLKSEFVYSVSDYLNNPVTIFKDNSQILLSYEQLCNEMFEYRTTKDVNFISSYMFELNDIKTNRFLKYETVNNLIDDKKAKIFYINDKKFPKFQENVDAINLFVKDNIYLGNTIIICLKKYQIANFLKHINFDYVLTEENNIIKNKVNIIEKNLSSGFIYNDLVVITEKELFNITDSKIKYKTNFKYASKIKDINKLNLGDYVVHNIHGIGVYNGIKVLGKENLLRDYLEILYYGKDKLYIPVEKIDLISKFSGKEGMVPKINKLGGTEWEKTKLRVKNKIRDIAEKLLKLYAIRESEKGYSFALDDEMQYQFEKSFEFTETKDQLIAIEQIKKDMESSKPMDRLLCGDVGYGKTEVAFRAMFKAVLSSKQVLYLCPTTILSAQQHKNAIKRFSEFPVNIGLLNRFTTPKESKAILEGLRNGTIDIVFGTHRLLSNDIKPKNLGLLVIDEEQRFGVTHKEKIKEYKSNVDVLTLTATPIPRTLQMSMVGIRSLSLIETPPIDRYPIQTYVIEENNIIIKDAVYKELSRNGQIFILYNRVEYIEKKMAELKLLIPEAKIVVAHGQLSKTDLENRMISFINHEYDILLCTTIIETGIDIPNVNTLIILDADKFGLSQLYQIRGRVGRSNKIAYAYLMYNKAKVLTETAIKRLSAIKEFTELGAGFSIATRDLSIRGAGDILGSEQAGFIDTIGIDLYIRMLNEEVAKLKGESFEEEQLEEKPLLNISTHISNNYVDSDDLKIEIHRLINKIDSFNKLVEVQTEIEDRFGKITDSMNIYMHEEWFEKLARKHEIEKVYLLNNKVELIFSKDISKKVDGESLFVNAFKITPLFSFKIEFGHLIITLDTQKLDKHYIYYLIDLLEVIAFKN